jgi:hypothetical protein
VAVSCRRIVLLVVVVLVGVAAGAPMRAARDTATVGHAKHLGHLIEPELLVRALRRGGHEDWVQRTADTIESGGVHHHPGLRAGVRDFAADVRPVDTLPGHWGARHLTL